MDTPWDNLSDAIFDHARSRPDAPAIIEGPATLSYGAFAELVAAAAAWLRGRGIGEDDRVGLMLTGSTDHLLLWFGLLRIGATSVEFSTETPPAMMAVLVEKLGLRVLFHEATLAPPDLPLPIRLGLHWRDHLPRGEDARSDRDASANLMMRLTSGSTGVPKAVVMSHRQRMNRAGERPEIYGELWSPGHPGNFILANSLSHAGFQSVMTHHVLMGGAVILAPKFGNVAELVRFIGAHDDVVSLVTPNMCRIFLQSATGQSAAGQKDATEGFLFPKVRLMFSGGLPLYAEEKRAMAARVTPNFFDVYGASGIGTVAVLRPEEMAAKAESVGRPLASHRIEIVDAEGRPLPPGAVGRLRCGGPARASGFAAAIDQGAGTELFQDEWYYPGDMAALDADGYLHLKGRAADLIHQNGIEIFPPEIEEVIATLPAVAEVIVVGRPARDGLGEESVAYVVARGTLGETEIRAHCDDRLPPAKRPTHIALTAALPKNVAGKIDRISVKAAALRQSPQSA